jgi:uncharacterized membrane protein
MGMSEAGAGGTIERERVERLERQVTELSERVWALEWHERSGSRVAGEREAARERHAAPERPARDATPPPRFVAPSAPRPRPAAIATPVEPAPRPHPAVAPRSVEPAPQPRPAVATRPVEPARQPVSPTLSLAGVAERLGAPDREALEDMLGGRVLAWVGGLAVLLGIAFLFAMAASRGWIDESARVALAALGATALLTVGVWLHERKGRTDAALAAVASGVAGMFVTITVAAQVYELVPDLVAIVMAVATGAAATGLAVRWESRGIGALGILGALVAPVLAGAEPEGASVAILWVALASAAGVLLWQRWDWLALAAFGVSAPQWAFYLFDGAGLWAALLTLAAFGALGVALAAGHEMRVRADSIRPTSAFLLALNALAVAAAGWFALEGMGEAGAGKVWLAGLAAVHVAFGLAAPRLARVSRDLGLLSLVLGVLLANVAFGLIADGVVLTAGWAASSVGFAALARRPGSGPRDAALVQAGLGGHIALALIHTLAVDAPVSELSNAGPLSAAGAAGIVMLAAACLVSGRLAGEDRPEWRAALDGLGLAALAYLTAMALDGPAVALAWTAESAALLALAHGTRDRVAGWAALGFLTLAGGHVLAFEVPPESLTGGVADPVPSLAALGAVAAAAIAAARVLPAWLVEDDSRRLRLALDAAGALAVAYLTILLLDGAPLTAALAAEALGLALLARRFGDRPAGVGALAFLGAAALHGVVNVAPPVSLVTGLGDPLGAVGALGAVVGAAFAAAGALATLDHRTRPALLGAAGVVALYLASGLVVTPFESADAVDTALLSAHQQGQMVLSVFWALTGVGVLVTGLRRDLHALRLAGLALLGVTVAKVFFFDLATLSSIYRVVSFIGLGLLLLAGAFVWQRMRPRALPDLREAPEGIR